MPGIGLERYESAERILPIGAVRTARHIKELFVLQGEQAAIERICVDAMVAQSERGERNSVRAGVAIYVVHVHSRVGQQICSVADKTIAGLDVQEAEGERLQIGGVIEHPSNMAGSPNPLVPLSQR